MIEVFAHDVYVREDEECQEIVVICGKGWENEPFKLYLTKEEAMALLIQLGYYAD